MGKERAEYMTNKLIEYTSTHFPEDDFNDLRVALGACLAGTHSVLIQDFHDAGVRLSMESIRLLIGSVERSCKANGLNVIFDVQMEETTVNRGNDGGVH